MESELPRDASLPRAFLWPVLAWMVFALYHSLHAIWVLPLAVAALVLMVLGAVHHAEVLAARVGEPFGALLLALSVTVIEVSIIVSLMLTIGEGASVLARNTVFAAIMIILTGMTGVTLLIGGLKFREQEFSTQGVTELLTVLVAISVLTLVLPNFTSAMPGPYYSNSQLVFVAVITLALYGSLLFVQNFRHKDHFVGAQVGERTLRPTRRSTILSAVLLPVHLGAVVLLAESMAPDLDTFIDAIGAPVALSGIIIACVVLLPEGISAVRAAGANELQRSLNLSLGSALASVSLTIPVVALVALATGMPLAMGIDAPSTVLFLLSLLVLILSLSSGRTNVLQGLVLMLLFAVYLFVTLFP
jgi:Ca2+:H+ antiporter